MMTERLLQYIWQFQYFNKNELVTSAGEVLLIVYPGQFNIHQGPDFLEGKIKIGDKLWVGSIELHVNASDWHKHAHDNDPNYNNVILHVVWKEDDDLVCAGLATLVLEDRISKLLLQQYELWMKSGLFIPCAQYIHVAESLVWTSWKERLTVERLERKAAQVKDLLELNNYHWEETLWWMLARTFGLYVNADAFEEVARSIPYSLISKHRSQIHQLEALLLGQAKLLDGDYSDKYALMLQKEYRFYKAKYELKQINIPVHFLRMRPAAFPTLRLAQLAMLMHTSQHLFSSVIDADNVKQIKGLLNVTANDYWHYHFTFGEKGDHQPKVLGAQMVNSVVANAIVPLLFSYGQYHQELRYRQKALDWLNGLNAERNSITKQFEKTGVGCKHAGDSQALIELKTMYCDKRKCLDCMVGNAILKRKVV